MVCFTVFSLVARSNMLKYMFIYLKKVLMKISIRVPTFSTRININFILLIFFKGFVWGIFWSGFHYGLLDHAFTCHLHTICWMWFVEITKNLQHWRGKSFFWKFWSISFCDLLVWIKRVVNWSKQFIWGQKLTLEHGLWRSWYPPYSSRSRTIKASNLRKRYLVLDS